MKLMTPFTAAGHQFLIRIDLNEIAAYMPLMVSQNIEKNIGTITKGILQSVETGTTIILKSGETMAIQESVEQLDKLFADKEIINGLNI